MKKLKISGEMSNQSTGFKNETRSRIDLEKGKFLFLMVLLFLCACAPTRRLSPGEELNDGAKITFIKPNAITKKKALEEELYSLIRPRENKPFKLWIYNIVKQPKKQKGFKYWLKYKVGEPPVLFNYNLANRSRLVLEKKLHDNGYLNAIVLMDTVRGEKRVKTTYDITATKRYEINMISWPTGNSIMQKIARRDRGKSLLKKGQFYDVETLRAQRIRMAETATRNGYYGINQDDVYFYVDTISNTNLLNVYIRWKPAVDSSGVKKYHLGETIVYPSFSLADSLGRKLDTINHKDLTIIENDYFVKEKLLDKVILGQNGDLYNGGIQTRTINYLQDLGIFKFINLRTEQRFTDSLNYLDRLFYLTPAQVRDIRFDFEANTRSGSYFGILAAANYANKNWFGGAERLDINLSVGGETQVGNTTQFINTLEITSGVSLSVPGLLRPFKLEHISRNYVARTRFNLTNAFQIRNGFFNINRLSTDVVLDWRSSRKTRHLLKPLSISQNQVFNVNPDFQSQLDGNPRLKNSLENVLIMGGQYRLIYSTQDINRLQPYFFISSTIDFAGNIPYALARIASSKEAPYEIIGTPFSQFFKIHSDARYYIQRRKNTWAFRAAAGIVAPYGNVDVVPYSKQFFIGGSTSLRAFRLRELGPGSYVNPTIAEVNFFDQTGDINLEFNVEYRFDLASYFKGAVFLDGGNIWFLNETIGENKEGRFNGTTFFKEIALGTGLGFRIDFDYFVIRFDAAFPIRKPVYNSGFEWTFNELNIWSKSWRSENLVGHLAIGYPF